MKRAPSLVLVLALALLAGCAAAPTPAAESSLLFSLPGPRPGSLTEVHRSREVATGHLARSAREPTWLAPVFRHRVIVRTPVERWWTRTVETPTD